MTPPRSLLVGGPLDGETVSPSQQANFVWVELSSKGAPRCYAEWTQGRVLYRLVHRVRPYKYLYAGHTHAHCGACGGYCEAQQTHGGKRACDFCGEPLPEPQLGC